MKNLHGDIVAILDINKNIVVNYAYDAWGRPISCSGTMASTLGKINPFRYRGYVYDEETGMYYLRSRYYSSTTSRFLSPDDQILNCRKFAPNLYTYAFNNPCNYLDENGNMAVWLLNWIMSLYCTGIMPENVVTAAVVVFNGGSYTAFHEIAQIHVAKYLMDNGRSPVLEYSIAGVGEADVVASEYVWEIKPVGKSGAKQLEKYTSKLAYTAGYAIPRIDDIPIIGNIKMQIESSPIEKGVLHYSFYIDQDGKRKKVESTEVREEVRKVLSAATWSAIAILGVTFAEDILTAGAGLLNDIPSFVAAFSAAAAQFAFAY